MSARPLPGNRPIWLITMRRDSASASAGTTTLPLSSLELPGGRTSTFMNMTSPAALTSARSTSPLPFSLARNSLKARSACALISL